MHDTNEIQEQWSETLTLGDLMARAAHLRPGALGIVFPDAEYTYTEIHEGSLRVAKALVAMGVAPGDRVGVLAENSIEYVHGFFGVAMAGAVVVPINVRLRENDLRECLITARLKALLTTSAPDDYLDFVALLTRAMDGLDAHAVEAPTLALLRGSAEGVSDADEMTALGMDVGTDVVYARRARVAVRDVALIAFTSGTTSRPKGCMLSHEALVRGTTYRARTRLGRGRDDVTWAPGPLFHIGALSPFIGSVGSMGTFLSDTFFDAGRALRLMDEHRVTCAFPWFPAIVQALLDHEAFARTDLGELRSILAIGPLPLMHQLQAALPHAEFLASSGMTETAGIYALSGPGDSLHDRVETQGLPVPGVELEIRDPFSDEPVEPDVAGELLVRCPTTMLGYFGDPEQTVAALTDDGWLRTGDLYSRRADGYITFRGRLKDMLKVGGENVSAMEIENLLCSHPAVRIASVVGRPDDRLDEVPVAFVELHPGASCTESELKDFARRRVARYKVPAAVIFIGTEDWPMSTTKIDKAVLRARVTT